MPIEFLLVGLGGSLGAASRFAITNIIKRKLASEFPFATFIINLCGSFLLGILLASQMGNLTQLLLGTGFMGGFTTFSTFHVENIRLLQKKRYVMLGFYFLASSIFCILAALLGLKMGSSGTF
ncbi:fluoride efflux transporter CrcB [Sinanaerobacter chloroacetimidivorans]|uniref:Fluoride-specific ion channel FluC n=1 Tax=Sinanaerobacter chloroacetimidivorans TaxID=2818044 RepID=A0A8J7W1D2_9FIRM|nr:fluoride efflux transporter CrcB [Sinanaerobacter chloroacetimidivorans]MBR0599012.1 fluoride efflux transporter CrcB [Sinanaerobacter chloroacetimidivorans]